MIHYDVEQIVDPLRYSPWGSIYLGVAKWLLRTNFLSSCLNWIVGRFLQVGFIACLLLWPGLFLVQAAASVVIMACAPAGFHAMRRTRGEALWSFGYGLFWLVGLWWISPYALMTVRNDKWLTRDLAPGSRFPIPVRPRPTPLTNRPAA